ncbi:nitrilase-related carbon-nitrogen hydrolase [Sorangium sp. So ce233]|uniref:nitrilase-related carbon-nitrogen hydrolase n=1 Tax=Sorangium sp. So ce233 TaxID=3133290 RepID=UPI003F61EFE3
MPSTRAATSPPAPSPSGRPRRGEAAPGRRSRPRRRPRPARRPPCWPVPRGRRPFSLEGQCFVIASCAVVAEQMTALLCDAPDRAKLLLPGGGFAMTYGPDGRPLAQPLDERAEGLLHAELDLGLIPLARAVADPTGHHARPDVLRLMFNDRPQRIVQRFDAEPGGADGTA